MTKVAGRRVDTAGVGIDQELVPTWSKRSFG
jgi:hypothetical protein